MRALLAAIRAQPPRGAPVPSLVAALARELPDVARAVLTAWNAHRIANLRVGELRFSDRALAEAEPDRGVKLSFPIAERYFWIGGTTLAVRDFAGAQMIAVDGPTNTSGHTIEAIAADAFASARTWAAHEPPRWSLTGHATAIDALVAAIRSGPPRTEPHAALARILGWRPSPALHAVLSAWQAHVVSGLRIGGLWLAEKSIDTPTPYWHKEGRGDTADVWTVPGEVDLNTVYLGMFGQVVRYEWIGFREESTGLVAGLAHETPHTHGRLDELDTVLSRAHYAALHADMRTDLLAFIDRA